MSARQGTRVALLAFVIAGLSALVAQAAAAEKTRKIYDYEIINTYPHDAAAFTQGLFVRDGYFYESTGLNGASSLRKVDIETGEVLSKRVLAERYFGEGIAPWQNGIVGLTWKSETGFVYDFDGFEEKHSFAYSGEGWGITSDDERLIMSDGTADLRFLDPETLAETGRVTVTHGGTPVTRLNELEFIDGEVFANIWGSDLIIRIDPSTGVVIGVIDLRPLRTEIDGFGPGRNVLNGIAYEAETGRLFVTGKNWPNVFEIRLIERPAKAQ